MSGPTNQAIARHGTNILELVTQVTDDLNRGTSVARITDQQLVAIRNGSNTVIKQCQEMERRLASIEKENMNEEERLQRQIGAIERSVYEKRAKVRNLELMRSREEAVLQAHERDLTRARNQLDEARKRKKEAVSDTVIAGVTTAILGVIFLPSLLVSIPVTAAFAEDIKTAENEIDRIYGNIGRIRSDISSTEREIRSRNDGIRQHEVDISRLRSSCCELEKKRGYLRKNISFVLQAKAYFTELMNATQVGDQRTEILQTIVAKFHARRNFSFGTRDGGVRIVANSFYEAWQSFEDQVLSGKEYLSLRFSDVQ